jgi:hypothetical protein
MHCKAQNTKRLINMSAAMQAPYVMGIEIMVFWTSLWVFNSSNNEVFILINNTLPTALVKF